MSALVPSDIKALPAELREHQVTLYLENARDRLALAVEMTGPEAVASIKAELATMAEATKQLGLSKEIREDASEMVRRAEYALGKAIRKGQAEGTVLTHADGPRIRDLGANNTKISPSDVAPHHELVGNGGGIYAMSDDVTPEQFEEALTEAKVEGNLSRANIVRKVNDVKSPETRDMRAQRIADLAGEGHDSHQIAQKLGVHRQTVLSITKDYSIALPADAVTHHRKGRVSSAELLSNITASVESTLNHFDLVNPRNLGQGAQEELDSLAKAATAIARKARQIKSQISNQGAELS